MRIFLPPFVFLFLALSVNGQNFQNLSFGTDSTLEVVSWNIEWFPKNTQTTVNYVTQIIQALDVDVLALQEIDDTNRFKQMVANLDGYSCYFRSGYFAGLAYIYKNTVVEINDIYQIYTTNPYWDIFPRDPMVMDFNCMGENYIVINNHLKCCGDNYIDYNDPEDEEYRRLQADNLLKDHIDYYWEDKKVFVVGDLNDIITEPTTTNVFIDILNDPDNYRFADMPITQGNSQYWYYPSWPSHLDHILVTNDLYGELETENTLVQTLRLDQHFSSWYQYDQNDSDHRPVGIRFFTGYPSAISENTDGQILSVFPNPAAKNATVRVKPGGKPRLVRVFDVVGNLIFSADIEGVSESIFFNTDHFSSGIYMVCLSDEDRLISSVKFCVVH